MDSEFSPVSNQSRRVPLSPERKAEIDARFEALYQDHNIRKLRLEAVAKEKAARESAMQSEQLAFFDGQAKIQKAVFNAHWDQVRREHEIKLQERYVRKAAMDKLKVEEVMDYRT